MNLATKSVFDVVILAVSNLSTLAIHAGPGPREQGAIAPRSIAMREAAMFSPCGQQPAPAVGDRAGWARKSYAEATAATLTKNLS